MHFFPQSERNIQVGISLSDQKMSLFSYLRFIYKKTQRFQLEVKKKMKERKKQGVSKIYKEVLEINKMGKSMFEMAEDLKKHLLKEDNQMTNKYM